MKVPVELVSAESLFLMHALCVLSGIAIFLPLLEGHEFTHEGPVTLEGPSFIATVLEIKIQDLNLGEHKHLGFTRVV